MRINILFILGLSLFASTANAQRIKTSKDSLKQLQTPQSSTHDYINFTIFKLMNGLEVRGDKYGSNALANSFNVQIICPFAILRNSPIHLTYGLVIGNHKMSFREAELNFMDNELISIQSNSQITKSVQKTTYAGLVLMPFVQPSKNIDIMAGAAILFNVLGNKLKVKDEKTMAIWNGKSINRISVPLLLQLDIKLGIFSLGPYASHDLRPRFKGEAFKDLKQTVVGLSAGINM